MGELIISSYNDRPGKLFDGLEHIRLSILFLFKGIRRDIATTKYNKWITEFRPNLFTSITYIKNNYDIFSGSIIKFGSIIEYNIINKILNQKQNISNYENKNGKDVVYYTRKLSGFVQILDCIPLINDESGKPREPSELKQINFQSREEKNYFFCLLNSNLFYWFLSITSDCRNLNKREIYNIPTTLDLKNVGKYLDLGKELSSDLNGNSKMLKMGNLTIQCFYPKLSKPIIDEIDRVLAKHYGFTDEELDYIINYDIKYRMGAEGNEE